MGNQMRLGDINEAYGLLETALKNMDKKLYFAAKDEIKRAANELYVCKVLWKDEKAEPATEQNSCLFGVKEPDKMEFDHSLKSVMPQFTPPHGDGSLF